MKNILLIIIIVLPTLAYNQITINQYEVKTRYAEVEEYLKDSRCNQTVPYNQDEMISLFIETETYVEQEQYDLALMKANEIISKWFSDSDNLREGYSWQGYIHLVDTNNVAAISSFEQAEALICKEKADDYSNLMTIQCLGYALYNEQRYAEAYEKLQKVEIRNTMSRVKAFRAGESYQSVLFEDFEKVLKECKEKMNN